MHWLDFSIFVVYMILVFLVGVYFYRKNKSREDYYVGSRSIKSYHVGLSVVATDVGGGFSIGLGGLGFTMGLSGSWLLFTGLIGAWLAAVFIIPKLKKVDAKHGMLTYPDYLRHIFGNQTAFFAALISGFGYMGFTGGQVLAGAKLSSGTLFMDIPLDIDPMIFSIVIIAGIILIYTVMGGLKAVIYTDTIQWIILLVGLIFFAIPFAFADIGGVFGFSAYLPERYFDFNNVSWSQVVNWFVTIIPIWLIGMTLYQRMYACADEKQAKRAWFIAGVFEWPIMAFTGVVLGMAARVFFPESEPELGLPRLLQEVLPIGIKGIVIAAYFSAIMSTADSCLIASSGNLTNDVLERYFFKNLSDKWMVRLSQIVTLFIGIVAIVIAISFQSVLDVILQAYSFMVAGLFIPTLFAYFGSKRFQDQTAAISSMLTGGVSALILIFSPIELPYGLDATIFGIFISLATYCLVILTKGYIVKKS
jgi:SSS family solute:Na+ symporter